MSAPAADGPRPWTVWDLGANHGEDTAYYLALGCRVIAVEPNPTLAEEIRLSHEGHLASGGLTVVEAAVMPEGGPDHLTLSVFENDEWSTVRADWVDRNVRVFSAPVVEEVEVACASLGGLRERFGTPSMMKIDIEGVDLSIMGDMAGDADAWSALEYLTWETMFQEPKSLPVLRDQIAVASRIGFRSFAISSQNHAHQERGVASPDAWPPAIGYPFRRGASGPFADQLDGTWMDAEEVVRAYGGLSAVRRGRLYGPESHVDGWVPARLRGRAKALLNKALGELDWFDIHARRA